MMSETITIARQFLVHLLNERRIRRQEAASQSIYQHFLTEVVKKIILSMLADIGPQTLQTRALAAAGEISLGFRPAFAAQIHRSCFTNGAIPFKDQAH